MVEDRQCRRASVPELYGMVGDETVSAEYLKSVARCVRADHAAVIDGPRHHRFGSGPIRIEVCSNIEHFESGGSDADRRIGQHERHTLERGYRLAEGNAFCRILGRIVRCSLGGSTLGGSDHEAEPANHHFKLRRISRRSAEELRLLDRGVDADGEQRGRAERDSYVVRRRSDTGMAIVSGEERCAQLRVCRIDPDHNQRFRSVGVGDAQLFPLDAPPAIGLLRNGCGRLRGCTPKTLVEGDRTCLRRVGAQSGQ